MADEKLRQNLDRAFDAGPDFPPPWLLSRTMSAISDASDAVASRRRRLNLRLSPATQRALAVLLVLAVATAAAGAYLALHNSIPAAPRGTIEIGSDEPTFGTDAPFGLPEQYGAAFAVSRIKSVRGFKLRLVPYDDSVQGRHDAQKGVENVQSMLNDPALLGMLVPFPSGVAWAEIPVANRGGLAMISASNGEDCLTLDLAYCQDLDGFTPASLRPARQNNYFRIAAAYTFQAIATAQFAYDTLGLRKIAMWEDGVQLDAAIAGAFAKAFTRKGGEVVARTTYDYQQGPPDFRPWLRTAKAAGAQGIFAGAVSFTYGCVARGQSQGIFAPDSYYFGLSGMGSFPRDEGIANAECIRDAGAMANDHMYTTLGVPDAELNSNAAEIVAAYLAAHPNPADLSDNTFASYDAAAMLVDAIGRAIDSDAGGRPTRQQVLDQLAQTTNFHGLTGTYTFDANGDPKAPGVAILQNQGGNWNAVRNVAVSDCIVCET